MLRASPVPDRATLILAFRSHPEWTLAQLLELDGTEAGSWLERVRVGDLWTKADRIDLDGLARAMRLRGPEFDACVLEVIREAAGIVASVSASYLRARVGGPRWKLQAALGRLADAGEVERSGTTSGTRYRLAHNRPRD